MKRTTRKRISPKAEGRFIKIIIGLILAFALWLVFAPDMGLLSLMRSRAELAELQQQTVDLQDENNELQSEIDRIQNDPEYLEELARKEYGLLKKNERVFDFSKGDTSKKK